MSKSLPPSEDSLAASLVVKPVKTSPVSRRQVSRPALPIRQWVRLSGLMLLLAGASTLVGFSLWLSAMIMLRPQPPRWLVQYWPGLAYEWSDQPIQTLAEIEAELTAQAQQPGAWIDLTQASDRPELRGLKLLPVLETRSPCTRDCEAIVELRLYNSLPRRQSVQQLQLLHQLQIQGQAESDMRKTLLKTDVSSLGSTYELPLTAVKPLHEAALPGLWLTLTGRWRTQGSPVLYGQMLYVNPQLSRITSVLNWHSPPGRLPAWHNVDQQGLPELLVNQSYGLEPNFKLYRVDNPQALGTHTRLEEITLTPLPIAKPVSVAYKNALFFAQRGLWSDAQRRLSTLKTQLAGDWSDELEQQRQLVALHGRFSTEQAQRDWSQPSQKLLALLLDGRWQAALEQVKGQKPGFSQAVLPLLKRDSNRVWQRLTATLQVDPKHKEARFWSALVLMAKEDKAAALKWLAKDAKSPLRKEFEAIAQAVTPPPPTPVMTAAANTTAAAEREAVGPGWDGWVGRATSVATVDAAAWQRSSNAPAWTLPAGQQWFTVELQFGHQRQQWQRSPTFDSATTAQSPEQLWQTVGLGGASATLHGVDLSADTTQTLEVMGTRWQGQRLVLLARGVATANPLLVTTLGFWTDANGLNPSSLETALAAQPALNETLQSHLGLDPVSLVKTLQQQADAAFPWALGQSVNLVEDSSPEWLITLYPEVLTAQGWGNVGSQATQLITDAQGQLLYSNEWSGAVAEIEGWIDAASGQPILVVTQGDRPEFLLWSPQNRQFQ